MQLFAEPSKTLNSNDIKRRFADNAWDVVKGIIRYLN